MFASSPARRVKASGNHRGWLPALLCHGYQPLQLRQADGMAHGQEAGTVRVQVVAGSTHRGVGVIGGQETARVGWVFGYRREVGHPLEKTAVSGEIVYHP